MRSVSQTFCELLEYVVDQQWAGQHNTACSCHPEYVECCPSCSALQDTGVHKDDCALKSLITDAETYRDRFESAEEFVNQEEEDVNT